MFVDPKKQTKQKTNKHKQTNKQTNKKQKQTNKQQQQQQQQQQTTKRSSNKYNCKILNRNVYDNFDEEYRCPVGPVSVIRKIKRKC